MKVLVTGATGFLGSHLVERLKLMGDEVVCIAKDKLNAGVLEALEIKVVFADLNSDVEWGSVLQDVEVVYHLAGATRARNPKEYFDSNFRATQRFVEACANHCPNLKRFVYLSSLAAVGPSLDGVPLCEDAAYRPVSDYGKSKMLGELEVLKSASRLPVTVIRPSSVYGPREKDMFELIRLVNRGVFPVIGFKDKFLSIVHADDLIDGVVRASLHPRAVGEVYYLGSEKMYSTQQIGKAIGETVKRSPFYLRIPHSVVYSVAAIAELMGKVSGQQVFLNIQKANEVVQPAWTCSIEKAKSHFGFSPQVSLEDGMRKTHSWYRDNGWL